MGGAVMSESGFRVVDKDGRPPCSEYAVYPTRSGAEPWLDHFSPLYPERAPWRVEAVTVTVAEAEWAWRYVGSGRAWFRVPTERIARANVESQNAWRAHDSAHSAAAELGCRLSPDDDFEVVEDGK